MTGAQSPRRRADNKSLDASLTRASSVSTNESRKKVDEANSIVKEQMVRLRLKKIDTVPPFNEDIFQRGQWEIVIIRVPLSWIIVGSLFKAVPVWSCHSIYPTLFSLATS